MSTSSLSSLARMSLASCCTDCRDAKSNFLTITLSFPLLFLTSSAALLALSMSLQARMTLAPVYTAANLVSFTWNQIIKGLNVQPRKSLTPSSHVHSSFFANPSVASSDQDGLSNQRGFAATHSARNPFLHTKKSHSCKRVRAVTVMIPLHLSWTAEKTVLRTAASYFVPKYSQMYIIKHCLHILKVLNSN